MMAFASARTAFERFHEWMPSRRAVLRMVDAIGAESRPFLEQDPAPVDDGDVLVIEVEYLTGHHARLRYQKLRRDDLPVATGVIEGAIRNLIRVCLEGPGTRRSRDRAEQVLHPRCTAPNGQWDTFTRFIATRSVRLAAQPTPTRTHHAKPQLFADAACFRQQSRICSLGSWNELFATEPVPFAFVGTRVDTRILDALAGSTAASPPQPRSGKARSL